jgi:hypothetical protein
VSACSYAGPSFRQQRDEASFSHRTGKKWPTSPCTRSLHRKRLHTCPDGFTHLPPTGSSLTAVAPVLRPSCVAHGSMTLGGEADRGSRRGCRDAVDVPGRNPGLVPGKWARATGRPDFRQAARPRERHGRAVGCSSVRQDVAARNDRARSRRHAECCGWSWRTLACAVHRLRNHLG